MLTKVMVKLRDEMQHEQGEHAGKVWVWIQQAQKELWKAWVVDIGPALVNIRNEAKEVTRHKPGNYSGYMKDLLKAYRLDGISKDERAAILNIMDNLSAVQTWRSKQDNPDALNNPQWVWRQYQKSAKQQDEKDKNKKPNVKEPEADLKEQNEQLRERLNEVEEENKTLRERVGEDEEDDSDKPIFERIATWSNKFIGLWKDIKSWPKLTKPEERKREKLLATLSETHRQLSELAEAAAKRENPNIMMEDDD